LAKIAIVGGGVIGTSIALELASSSDAQVDLFESESRLGSRATSAAIGGITPQSEALCRGPLRHVAVWSTELFRPLLDHLERKSSIRVPILDSGQLIVAFSDNEMQQLLTELLPVWSEEGFETNILSTKELLQVEPLLNPNLAGGLLLPIEFALNPAELMAAMQDVLSKKSNTTIRLNEPIEAIESFKTHATAHLKSGQCEHYDSVVIAAGLAVRNLLPQLATKLYPMRGQAVEFRAAPSGYTLNHHVYAATGESSRSCYLVPRHDGRVVGGVTYEPNENSETPDESTIGAIIQGLKMVCPAVDSWERIRSWSGVRPASVDGTPFVGFVDTHERVVACAGHQGLGITLAPASAKMVSALLRSDFSDESTRNALEICALDRKIRPNDGQ